MNNRTMKALESSTAALKDFYCVVTALALGAAITEYGRIVAVRGGLVSALSGWDGKYCTALTVVFIATIIPFYHGAVRYMDMFAETGIRSRTEQLQFIADFVMLFLEGALFIAMGMNVAHRNRSRGWPDRKRL
jgi:hypothetical protein